MIDLEKLSKMAGLVFQNSIRLHSDSIILFNNKSYSSAYFLSVLALEEFGKIFWIDDLLWHLTIGSKWSEEDEQKWLEAIFFHIYKQKTFAHHLGNNLPKKYIESISSGKLDIEKQNAIYVGLPRSKRSVDIGGKIINPLKLSCQKSEKQITIVNDSILEYVLGNIKGIYSFQSQALNGLMTRKLYRELRAKWKRISPKIQKRIANLEEIEDSIED